ncbi:MAG TPA: DUF2845 domain-containing protein [Syntrophales bacterium]|nr:DUF2845 domain-containing protein [Syntrophales bacterium]
MKKIIVVIVVLLFCTSTALAFRCGGNIAKVGDSGFQLLLKCGEPIKKIPMGFTGETIKLIVEKWIYGPDGGYYYEVVVMGDKIVSISKVRDI